MKQDLLIFNLGTRERFAVAVSKTREIIPLGHLNKLPGSHPLVLGVAKVRDRIIPIIDTQGILFSRPLADRPKMAIVLDLESPVALAVAEVSHVHKFDDLIHTHSEGKGCYVETVIQDDGGLIQKIVVESLILSITKAEIDADTYQRPAA